MRGCLAILLPVAILLATGAGAQERSISLVDIHQGSSLSGVALGLARGGYELQDGTWVRFAPWYTARWVDLETSWLLQLSDDTGILLGLATGEWGDKYRIDPSLRLGVIVQAHPRPAATLTVQLGTVLGGTFTELPCTADYGEIGGIQQVNCRLAASELAPEETLKYLVKADPGRLNISLAYRVSF